MKVHKGQMFNIKKQKKTKIQPKFNPILKYVLSYFFLKFQRIIKLDTQVWFRIF